MSGTHAGSVKAVKTIKARDPDHFKKIGHSGGVVARGYTFAHGKITPQEAGRMGGKRSRRTGVKNGEGKSRSALARRIKTAPIPKPKFWQFRYRRHLRKLGIK